MATTVSILSTVIDREPVKEAARGVSGIAFVSYACVSGFGEIGGQVESCAFVDLLPVTRLDHGRRIRRDVLHAVLDRGFKAVGHGDVDGAGAIVGVDLRVGEVAKRHRSANAAPIFIPAVHLRENEIKVVGEDLVLQVGGPVEVVVEEPAEAGRSGEHVFDVVIENGGVLAAGSENVFPVAAQTTAGRSARRLLLPGAPQP